MIRFADWLGHWSVDVYLLGTVLLILALLATAVLRQPVHRLTITKSLFIALTLLAALCAVPGWSALHLLTAKPPALIDSVQLVSPRITPADIPGNMPVTNQPPTTPILAAPPTPAQTLSRANISAWEFAGTIEFVGALAVITWLAAGWAAARTLRRESHEAPLHIQEIVQQVAKASSSKHAPPAKTFISNRINVPVALGLYRPKIILPADSPLPFREGPGEGSSSHIQLRTILAHELAHIQNHDLHWLALSRLLLIILWPQPLFWFARRRMRLDQESLADAAAADLTTREKYAEQLVAWARNLSNTYPTRLASAVGLWEGASQLRQRVALLLDERFTVLRQFSRKLQFSTLALCVAAAAALSLVTLRPAQSQDKLVIESETLGRGIILCPVTTELQRSLLGDVDEPLSKASLCAFVDFAALQDEPTDINSPFFSGLAEKLTSLAKSNNELVTFQILMGPPRPMPFDVAQKRAESLGKTCEALGKSAGFRHSRSSETVFGADFDWSKYVADAESATLQAVKSHCTAGEHSVGNERVRVFAASTFLSHMLAHDTDCVVNIKPFINFQEGPRFPEDFTSELQTLIPTLKYARHNTMLVRIRFAQSQKNALDHWFEGHDTRQAFARKFGFKKCIDQTSQAAAANVPPADAKQINHDEPQKRVNSTSEIPNNSEPPETAQLADEKEITGAVFQTGAPPGVPNSIDGQCVDETGKPLAGVEIILASAAWDGMSRREVAKQTTDLEGHFHFAEVVDIHSEYPDGKIPKFPNQNIATFQIAALKPGRESLSETLDQNQIASNGAKVHFAMNPGATLRGRITNPADQPVAGALVSVGFGQFDHWEGFQTVRTKANGSYEITDAPTLKNPDPKDGPPSELQTDPPSDSFGPNMRAKYQRIFVTQTDFADRLVSCRGIPGTQDIQLKPAAVIRGRVLDASSQKPIAGTRVFAMPAPVNGALGSDANFAAVTPDENGEYKIRTLPAGTYDLWVTGPDRVNKAIKNFKTTGAEITAPDLLLTTGGMLRVRLVNDKNGEPVALSNNDYAQIVVEPSPPYNPVGYMTPIDDRFSIRVIPGDVQVVSASATSNGELRWLIRPGDMTPAHVDEGKTTDVDIRVQKFDANTDLKAQVLMKTATAALLAGDVRRAVKAFDEIIDLDPSYPLNLQAYMINAHLLATASEVGARDGKRAIQLAKKAIELRRTPEPKLLDTLAAAYAEAGDFDKAIETQKQAIDLAAKENEDREYRPALKLYESHQPRQPKPAPKANSKQGANSQPNKSGLEPDKLTVAPAKTADNQFNVVIAKHVLLLNGNEVTTWEQLSSKVAALPDPSKAQLHFYFTNSALEAGDQQALHNKIYALSKKFKWQGHSEGSLLPRAGARYDRIVKQSDLTPDPSLRVTGTVVDTKNQPVAGAEIVLIAPVDESLPYKDFDIVMVQGRIRNPLDEIYTVSDATGHFEIYPPNGAKYRLLVTHPDFGFNLNDDTSTAKVGLIPWARLTCKLGAEDKSKQSADLRTHPQNRPGYPDVSINQYWEDLKLSEPADTFSFSSVPAILDTTIGRSFAEQDGGSVSIADSSVSLLPGEDRRIALGPLNDKQREWLQFNRDQFDKIHASQKTDAATSK